MFGGYEIIDSDTHVLEPVDLWERYIDPKFRSLAPKFAINEEGHDTLTIDGDRYGEGPTVLHKGLGHLGSFGSVWGHGELITPYQACTAGYDPKVRLKQMDTDGTDATFLYPSIGLVLGGLKDPEFAFACYRAYNRWLAEFCSTNPKRLNAVAMLPIRSVELAIEELRFCRKELGMKVAMVRPNPCHGVLLHDRVYEPLWKEMVDLDVSLSVHSGSAKDMETLGAGRFDSPMTRHIVSHSWEMMSAMLSLVYAGVCDRHPKLRVGFLEGGAGWVPGWLDRMDRHFDKVVTDDRPSVRPTEIFKRQCWTTFDPGEKTIPYVADFLGADRILYASDYPHADGVPDAPKMVDDRPGLDRDAKRLLFAENAKAYYGIS